MVAAGRGGPAAGKGGGAKALLCGGMTARLRKLHKFVVVVK